MSCSTSELSEGSSSSRNWTPVTNVGVAPAGAMFSDRVIFPRSTTGNYPGGRFPHPPDKPYLEPVVALAAAAMCTSHARVGASVFILGHRHPVVMAKMLTTIDALSSGRLICGVGVGWWKEEMEMLGAPFHARGRQADEILRLFKELWTADNPSFAGEFFQVRDVGFAPKPVQKPHPPIWVGGRSYKLASGKANTADIKGNTLWTGVAYKLQPNVTLTGAVYHIDVRNVAAGQDADPTMYVVRYRYAASKRTDLYATVGYTKAKHGQLVGLSRDDAAFGDSQHGVMVGMQHRF